MVRHLNIDKNTYWPQVTLRSWKINVFLLCEEFIWICRPSLIKKPSADVIFKRSGLYILYERHLESEIIKYPLPNHITIILDGNRRWAKTNLIRESTGHFVGADKAEGLLNWIHS